MHNISGRRPEKQAAFISPHSSDKISNGEGSSIEEFGMAPHFVHELIDRTVEEGKETVFTCKVSYNENIHQSVFETWS